MKKIFKMYERIKALSEQKGSLFIRGAGASGRILSTELGELGIGVTGFIDKNFELKSEVNGIPVIAPEDICKLDRGTFFIMVAVKDNYKYDSIVEEMNRQGLQAEVDFGDFSFNADIRMMSFLDVPANYDIQTIFRQSFEFRINEMRSVVPDFKIPSIDAYNLLPNLDVPLTTYCSLKCKHCSHCIPYAKPAKHFLADDIIADLDKTLSVSYVGCVSIMGGEPFVFPHLVEFLRKYALLKNRQNIGFTRIITNATILPKDEVFIAYKDIPNAYIYISNYGLKSTKIKEIVSKCEEFEIAYYVCPYDNNWYTLGDFSFERKFTEAQLKHLYAVCTLHLCTQLMNGRVYACGRTPVLNEYGLIPFSDKDFCDVRNVAIEELSDKLHRYLYETPYLNGCKYCDGQYYYSSTVARGE